MDFGNETITMCETSESGEPQIRERVLETLRTFGERTHTHHGKESGPSVLLVGGTHGNEILGVLMAGFIHEKLRSGNMALKAGTIRLALGNTRAIETNERTVPGGHDLNRIFTPDVLEGREERGWEGRRARRLAEDIQASDIVIDLHSTNKPSPAFVCSSGNPEHRKIYKWLPRKAVVLDPERVVSGGGGSIDEIADDFGKVGICYESGKATDASNLEPVFNAIQAILIEKGMIEGELPEPPISEGEYHVITSIPYVSGQQFEFAIGKDRGFAPVSEGELIGHRGGDPIYSPMDGVILFPKKSEHQESAGLVCYLAARRGSEVAPT